MLKPNMKLSLPIALGAMLLASCAADNGPGIEYMPDMYRGPAVEAYVDYGQDPYYFGEEDRKSTRLNSSH